jgi:hypothetical protein
MVVTMGGHPSEELDALTSITAAIEDTRAGIADMEIEVQGDVCRGSMRLIIPLVGANRLDDTQIDMDHARLADSELRIDLRIEIGDSGSKPEADQRSKTRAGSQATTGSHDTSDESTTQRDRRGDSPTERGEDGDSTRTPETREERQSPRGGDSSEQTDGSSRDRRPQYRDPEELAAVYDPNSTFEEMRTDLGVDVTAQTVRKYMIEYGIHKPEPRQDRLLESIHPSEFELASEEQNERTETADQTEDSSE